MIYNRGQPNDLDAWAHAVSGSSAVEVNRADQAVGTAITAGIRSRVTTFQAGQASVDLSGEGNGTGINNLGFVVGTRDGQGILKNPTTGAVTTLGFSPNAINDSNHVVGNGVLWVAGQFTQLGNLGFGATTAIDINNQDVVVGRSAYAAGATHAIRWDSTTGIRDLGTLGGSSSSANHINEHGEIVGFSTDTTGRTRAVLWSSAGEIVDLNAQLIDPTGWGVLSGAWGNNEQGAIVGVGLDTAGGKHAFLLTPDLPQPVPAIPDVRLPFAALLAVGWFAARRARRPLA